MKNKAILKRKCMELSLYTPNIFNLGQDQKVFNFVIFLDHKKSI